MNLAFNKNEDVLKQSLVEMRRRLEKYMKELAKKPSRSNGKRKNLLPGNGSTTWLMVTSPLSRSAPLRVMICMPGKVVVLPVALLPV